MTTPVAPDLSPIIPEKWKPWVGTLGALLTFVVPSLTEYYTNLPQPWPLVIGGVLLVLTWLGIYHAPYVPDGAVMVPEESVPAPPAPLPPPPAPPAAPPQSDPGWNTPWGNPT